MERKIGEIFEYNGEWYQCVKSPDGTCKHCDMNFGGKCPIPIKECVASSRSDLYYVIFKKLEKVGEPITVNGKNVQLLKTTIANCDNCAFYKDVNCDFTCYPRKCHGGEEGTYVEIKQTKEDMEDLDKIKVRDYTIVEQLNVMEEKKLNLKPFDIQKAREGKPVCTRDGRKARIICFDRVGDFPIVALTDDREYKEEGVNLYDINGKGSNECFDLMMLPEKKEGWVNIDKGGSGKITISSPYSTKEEAIHNDNETTIDTIKISWEE